MTLKKGNKGQRFSKYDPGSTEHPLELGAKCACAPLGSAPDEIR